MSLKDLSDLELIDQVFTACLLGTATPTEEALANRLRASNVRLCTALGEIRHGIADIESLIEEYEKEPHK